MKSEDLKFELAVIIVNYNTKHLLKTCLGSVFDTMKEISFEVIVVDNASSDGSVEMIKKVFPNVILIENRKNVGFAKANNQALNLIKNHRYILFLNSDAVLVSDSGKKLMMFLQKNEKAGAVSPALRFPDGNPQAAGGFTPKIYTAFNYFLFLSYFFPKLFKGLFIDHKRLKKSESPLAVDWIAGTCFMTKKQVIEEVGGMNESYFLYAEDAELCRRIKESGWQIFYLPYLEIIHYHGASSKAASDLWIKALIKYVKASQGILHAIIFRLLAASGLGLRWIFYCSLYILTDKIDFKEKSYLMLTYFKGALSSS